VRAIIPARRERPHLVTEAQRSMSEDIAYRQRRYLIMMGIRVVCFALAVVLYTVGAGWLTAFPAIGAIVIPYFAVVFANGGREPSSTTGFRAYEPRLPARTSGPSSGQSTTGPTDSAATHPSAFTDSNQRSKNDQETAGPE
jgi:hypothetical protein